MTHSDRRSEPRMDGGPKITLVLRNSATRRRDVFSGTVLNSSKKGLAVASDQILPFSDNGIIEMTLASRRQPLRARMKLRWRNDSSLLYGLELTDSAEDRLTDWRQLVQGLSHQAGDRRSSISRRGRERIFSERGVAPQERRRSSRRMSDLRDAESFRRGERSAIGRADLIPTHKGADYTSDAAAVRREWLRAKTGVSLKHVGAFSDDPGKLQGNIEHFIGVAQVPIGIAGPLKVNGDHAKGIYYVPMATTEGVLVVSYTLGMTILTQCGGVTAKVLKDEMHISPVFGFDTVGGALRVVEWIKGNFSVIKEEAEKTTKYGRLIRIQPFLFNRHVVLKFCYATGDAMGMNMINIATERACRLIVSATKPNQFYIRSNFSSDKKVTAHNLVYGKGKTVVADAIIHRKQIEKFHTTPEAMEAYYRTVLFTSSQAGMVGMNGQVANTIAALFIALGQDVASVANSSVGNTTFEVTKEGDLYASVYLPSLILGTVGGGTGLGTQNECLKLVGCDGYGKAQKLAEIVVATALAGELAICLAIANGSFVKSHSVFGRKGHTPI